MMSLELQKDKIVLVSIVNVLILLSDNLEDAAPPTTTMSGYL